MNYASNATAARNRRAARRNRRAFLASFLGDGLALLGCIALVAAFTLLAWGLFGEQGAASAASAKAPSASTYALVMVYNSVDAWQEAVAVDGLSFAQCDTQQRLVWSSDAASVVTRDGSRLPSVDAYCVASDDAARVIGD